MRILVVCEAAIDRSVLFAQLLKEKFPHHDIRVKGTQAYYEESQIIYHDIMWAEVVFVADMLCVYQCKHLLYAKDLRIIGLPPYSQDEPMLRELIELYFYKILRI